MRFGFNCIVVIGILIFSTTAFAVDRDECGTPEQMTSRLKAEDQHSFGSAERVERQKGINTLYGMIFTISGDRSVGYILQSDKPTGERASKICVHERLADLRIFDARETGMPQGSLLKATDADSKRRCAELVKAGNVESGTCGTLNATLLRVETHGERVMFQGFNVSKQPNGSYKNDGSLTTVTATLGTAANKDADSAMPLVSGVYYSSLPDGATITNVSLVYAEYTPYGLGLLPNR